MDTGLREAGTELEGQNRLRLWFWVLFAGLAALGAWLLIGPAIGPGWYHKPGFGRTAYEYSRPILLLFVPYALALWAWSRGARVPLRLLVGGAVLLHVLVLFAPLPQSQDFYQYLFYGRMQSVYGANPFVVDPSAFLDDPWYVWIQWYTQPSVYGPVWTMLAAGVTTLTGESLAGAFVALKAVILALDLAVIWLIVAAARGRGDPDRAGWGVLAYAWNPLILVTVPLAGSADVALAAGFLGAYLARRRGRLAVATLLLTGVALIKVYAVAGLLLHLVLVARQRGRQAALAHGALAGAVAALAYAPYWAGLDTFTGLLNAVPLSNLSLMGMVEDLIRPVLAFIGVPFSAGLAQVAVRLTGGGLLAAAVGWAVYRTRDEDSLWFNLLLVLGAYMYLTPWFLYWYIVAPLALVAALPRNRLTYPVLLFSGSSFIVLRYHPLLLNWTVQTALRYGLPLVPLVLDEARTEAREARRGDEVVPLPAPSTGVPARASAAE